MSYQMKSGFCIDFLGSILSHKQYETEFDNLDPVIRACYVENLLFEGSFWCNL
jgi:hypothetical protein